VPRIDVHAHVIPDDYRAVLPRLPDGSPPPLPPAPLEGLVATMERYGIDGAVVSTGPPGAAVPDRAQAVELARLANELVAGIVRGDPSRFAGLGVLPLPDVDAALTELAHALDVLELDGVMLLTNVDGTYLGEAAWDPLFDELDRRGAYVFVHPVAGPYDLPLAHWPVWLHEFPFDTTRAIVQLVYSGTLERCPNVRFQFAHLGGTAPFLAERIASLAAREPDQAAAAPAGAIEYLRRAWYDTGLSNNAVALASTLAAVPLERVVFGTDWPYAALPDGSDPAPDLGLDDDQRRLVDAVNARMLVPRLAAALGL
jgi:predicted TIM-barrel fold metal-dependent hydrolase